MKTLTISESKLYSMFFFLTGINRPVLSSHVSKLRKSILALGCIRPIIVANLSFLDGDEQTYIIDGQHLFVALRGLNLPIPYVVVKVKDEYDLITKVALLNASSKPWILLDYIRAWKYRKEAYQILHNCYMQYHIPFVALGAIAMNQTSRSKIAVTLKEGALVITNEHFATLCKMIVETLDVLSPKNIGFTKERLSIALLNHFNNVGENNYNHDLILSRVAKNKYFVLSAIGDDDAFQNLLQTKIFY